MIGSSRNILGASSVIGACCALLALVPTASWAAQFAHPVRVARLEGAIPEATMQGALFFRWALVVGAIAIPALVFAIVRLSPTTAEPSAAPHANEVPSAITRRSWVLLSSLIGIGAALRIALASESLWYDEISALLSFAIEGPGVAFGSYTVPTNHVPMTLAVWAMVTLTGGVSEFAIRAPAIIAGVAAIPVSWALAREVAPAALRDRMALMAALLVAIAPIPVLESVEARGYAFVMLGALVAALFLGRARRTSAAGDWVGFAVACAFATWAHPVAIVVPMMTGLMGLVRERTLFLASLLAGILALVVLAPLAGDVLATRADYLQASVDQPTLFSREGFEALVGLSLSWSLALPTAPWAGLTTWLPKASFVISLPLAFVAVLFLGAVKLFRDRALTRARSTAAPFALAFFVAMACSLILGTWIYARFLLFVIPFSTLVMAIGLGGLTRTRTRVVAVTLVALQAAVAYSVYSTKQPIRDAVAVVAAARDAGDAGDAGDAPPPVWTIGLPDNAVGFYARQLGFEAIPTGFLGDDLARMRTQDPRGAAFIIVLYPDRLSTDVLSELDRGFDRTHRFEGWADWGQGAVEIWRATPKF